MSKRTKRTRPSGLVRRWYLKRLERKGRRGTEKAAA